jgi:glycosyltransferase involved in cell wall biosynthesis
MIAAINLKPIAFVVQRYGLEVNGGAELHCRQVAERLAEHHEIEVLTTCAIDYSTWRNEYPQGRQGLNGVTIRRFPVDRERNPRYFYRLSVITYAQQKKKGVPGIFRNRLEERWMRAQGPYSSGLFRYLRQHQDDYRAFIFFTYLYCTTYYGLPLAASKALLVPTAHDEPPIYLDLFRKVFTAPRGILYNTFEERNLVQGLFGNQDISSEVVGLGIEVPSRIDETRVRSKFGLEGPYLLYLGRIEESKGCDELIRWFFSERNRFSAKFKLALVGRAVMPLPSDPDIVVTGFVSDEEKWSAIAGAFAIVVPSPYESLSMTLLEGWACGKPALVNGRCAVLKAHCLRSQAGLYYENQEEFWGALEYLQAHSDQAQKMGANGRAYVRANYTWERVLAKYQQALAWLGNSDSDGSHD